MSKIHVKFVYLFVFAVWGGVWVDAWGYVGGGCFAGIVVEFWRGLGGKKRLRQLRKKRINKIILFFYFVILLIGLFG